MHGARALVDKLIVAQTVKKIAAFYETQMLTTEFKTACKRTLS
jgi:hypothetical protein